MPSGNALMQMPQAVASVQSFYSALSHDREDADVPDTTSRDIMTSDATSSDLPALTSKAPVISSVEQWKGDIIQSVMKRFGMKQEDAIS